MCNCFVLMVFSNRKETDHVCAVDTSSRKVESVEDGARSRVSEPEEVGAGRSAISPHRVSNSRAASLLRREVGLVTSR